MSRRSHAVETLKPLCPPGMTKIKDSTLLLSYATLSTIGNQNSANIVQAEYLKITQQFKNYYIYKCDTNLLQRDDFAKAIQVFSAISIEDFLRFYVPDLVCDPVRFLRVFFNNLSVDQQNNIAVSHAIIQINKVKYKLTEAPITKPESDKPIKIAYTIYNELELCDAIRIPEVIFYKLFYAASCYAIDFEELNITSTGYTKKDLHKLAEILNNDLLLSKQEQVDMINYVHDEFYIEDAKILSYSLEKNTFAKARGSARYECIQSAIRYIIHIPRLDAYCYLSLYKRNGKANSRTSSDYTFRHNDVALENTFIYSKFTAGIDESKDRIAILFPSPFFIRKLTEDKALYRVPIVFVIAGEEQHHLIEEHYNQYGAGFQENTKMSFELYADWRSNMDHNQRGHFTKVLAFFNHKDTACSQDEFYSLIKKCARNRTELLSLISGNEFSNSLSPFSNELAFA